MAKCDQNLMKTTRRTRFQWQIYLFFTRIWSKTYQNSTKNKLSTPKKNPFQFDQNRHEIWRKTEPKQHQKQHFNGKSTSISPEFHENWLKQQEEQEFQHQKHCRWSKQTRNVKKNWTKTTPKTRCQWQIFLFSPECDQKLIKTPRKTRFQRQIYLFFNSFWWKSDTKIPPSTVGRLLPIDTEMRVKEQSCNIYSIYEYR